MTDDHTYESPPLKPRYTMKCGPVVPIDDPPAAAPAASEGMLARTEHALAAAKVHWQRCDDEVTARGKRIAELEERLAASESARREAEQKLDEIHECLRDNMQVLIPDWDFENPDIVAGVAAEISSGAGRAVAAEIRAEAAEQSAAALRQALTECHRLMEQNRPQAPTPPCYRAEWEEAIKDAADALAASETENRE